MAGIESYSVRLASQRRIFRKSAFGDLCPTEMEIEKWRPETGAQNPPRTDRNGKNCRTETVACQPNPRECRGFSHTGKYHPGDDCLAALPGHLSNHVPRAEA